MFKDLSHSETQSPQADAGAPPVAFGAHRYGQWGYIWHEEDDVAGWIQLHNASLSDPLTHWHGPVPLFDHQLERLEPVLAGESYFVLCLGSCYKPVQYGQHEGVHPVRVREAMAVLAGTKEADVIAALVRQHEIERQRFERLLSDRDALLAQTATK